MNRTSSEDVGETMEALEYGMDERLLQSTYRLVNNSQNINSESESEIFEIMEGARTGDPVQEGCGYSHQPEFIGEYSFADSNVEMNIHILGSTPSNDGEIKDSYTTFLNTSIPSVPVFSLEYRNQDYEEVELGDSGNPLIMTPPLTKDSVEEAADAASYLEELQREARELAEEGEERLLTEANTIAEELSQRNEKTDFNFQEL